MSHVPFITSDDAFMAGSAIGYWGFAQLRFVDPDVEVLDLVVTHVLVEVTEPSEFVGSHYDISVADLDDAAAKALDENLLGSTYAGYLAARDVDSPTLDAVIQVACFGRPIFG